MNMNEHEKKGGTVMEMKFRYCGIGNSSGLQGQDAVHLVIDSDKREYSMFISPAVGTGYVDVSRQADLLALAGRLKNEGWKDNTAVRTRFPETTIISAVCSDERGNPEDVVRFFVRHRKGIDPIQAITAAVAEYLDTEEGSEVRRKVGNHYNWGDFADFPPAAEICEKHGFSANVLSDEADRIVTVPHDCDDMADYE